MDPASSLSASNSAPSEGQTSPAKIAFDGFCTSEGGEEFSVGSRMTTKLTFQVTSDYDVTPPSTA